MWHEELEGKIDSRGDGGEMRNGAGFTHLGWTGLKGTTDTAVSRRCNALAMVSGGSSRECQLRRLEDTYAAESGAHSAAHQVPTEYQISSTQFADRDSHRRTAHQTHNYVQTTAPIIHSISPFATLADTRSPRSANPTYSNSNVPNESVMAARYDNAHAH